MKVDFRVGFLSGYPPGFRDLRFGIFRNFLGIFSVVSYSYPGDFWIFAILHSGSRFPKIRKPKIKNLDPESPGSGFGIPTKPIAMPTLVKFYSHSPVTQFLGCFPENGLAKTEWFIWSWCDQFQRKTPIFEWSFDHRAIFDWWKYDDRWYFCFDVFDDGNHYWRRWLL